MKVLKRRCYGIFDTGSLFQRAHLDVSGHRLYAVNKEALLTTAITVEPKLLHLT